ncbi:MAG: LysM peptidoglycan-binding domain-containing protein [Anaerolineae bacterium]|nr:LysM peptidoglycan-binding domain-containing protein [Anaerolineae bacterium]
MPRDDISHLPLEVQASIKAARQKAEEKKAEKDDKAISHLPPEVQAAIKAARQKTEEKEKTYVVQPGDSLSKIAKELLGDAARWPEIFELNKDQIKDPNLIQVGQELRIP